VVPSAVGATGQGGRTTGKNRFKVAAPGLGRVGALMVGKGMTAGADWADRVLGLAPRGDMSEAPTVPAMGIVVGGVCPLDHT